MPMLEMLDNRNAIGETRNVDVPQAAEVFACWAGWADKVTGDTIPVSESFST